MSNVGPLIRSPQGLQSSRTVRNSVGEVEENRAQLLELHIESGTVYVCPSRWQRLRLRWVFRYFNVLPLQLLHRYDQRLIEKLLQSAVVRPDLPVPKKAIFGVVEKVHSNAEAPAGKAITAPSELVTVTKPAISVFPSVDLANPEKRFVEKLGFGYASAPRDRGFPSVRDRVAVEPKIPEDTALGRAIKGLHNASLQRWALGVLTAVCFTVILAQICGISLLPDKLQKHGAPVERAANTIKPQDPHTPVSSPIRTLPATAPLPNSGTKHSAAPRLAEPALTPQKSLHPDQSVQSDIAGNSEETSKTDSAVVDPAAIAPPTAIAPAGTSKPLFVAELPQDHFVHPVVSDPNLVGDLSLKALIGADGSVKEVTVLRGNPKLAEAGIRAVRQWHFSPYQALGHPVEVETEIKMSFFGQDANSITSVANNSSAQLK